MKKIIFASHHLMAQGLKDTVQYVMPQLDQIETICAYMDNQPVEQQFKDVLGNINEQDEYLIFTDMLGGSVNQEAIKYLSYPNVYLITGMSLPIVLSVILTVNSCEKIDESMIRNALEDAKGQTVYVNDTLKNVGVDEDDE